VLGLEVEVDGAGGDPGLARDVRHARVEVALSREHAHRRLDDLLGLLRIAHGEDEPRFILCAGPEAVKRKWAGSPATDSSARTRAAARTRARRDWRRPAPRRPRTLPTRGRAGAGGRCRAGPAAPAPPRRPRRGPGR